MTKQTTIVVIGALRVENVLSAVSSPSVIITVDAVFIAQMDQSGVCIVLD